MSEGPRIAVAVVTMGNRPDEVDALLTSVAKQDVAPARIVIVGNGCPLPEFAERLGLPGEVTGIEVDENLGCPGGRNVGLARLRSSRTWTSSSNWTTTDSWSTRMCCARCGTCTPPIRTWASSASVSPTRTGRPSA